MRKHIMIMLTIVATIGAGVFVRTQVQIYDRVTEDIKKVNKEVMLIESNNKEISRQLEYVGSADFVEYIARTQLKYVKPDEIVFIDESEATTN